MKKKLIIFGIALVIIIVGIVMVCTLGFKLDFDYGGYTRINVYMNQESNLDDVKTIVSENFDGTYRLEYTDEFEDTISIKAQNISEEQITNIEDKIKEKYEFEEDEEYFSIINIPNVRVYDLVKDYILPVLLSFGIVLAYFAIAFRKLGIYKSLIEPALTVVLIGGVYVSVIAISRIPLNAYIIPLGIFIYIISLLGYSVCLNDRVKELVDTKKKK